MVSGGVRVGSASHARGAVHAARSSGDGEATSKQAAVAGESGGGAVGSSGVVVVKNREGSVGTFRVFGARRGEACQGGRGAKHGCRDPKRSCS